MNQKETIIKETIESKKQYSQKNPNRVVTLEELKQFNKGIIIDIPSFVKGEFIKVKVKRIDFTKKFLNKPEIQNFLSMPVISKYMNENKSSEEVEQELTKKFEKDIQQNKFEDLNNLLPLIDELVKDTLVDPTFADFEENCPLTEEQKMAIFGYSVGEMVELQNFRNNG